MSMKRIKAFLYVFFKSLTSIKYYQDVIKTHLNFSMKYFFTLSLTAALVVTAIGILPSFSPIKNTINDFLEQGRQIYPDDLIITSKDGKLSINQPEPYLIPFPDISNLDQSDMPEPDMQIENLVVFDSNGTLDDLENYKTLFLVNESNVLARGENKIEVYPLKDIPEGQITKTEINKIFSQIEQIAVYVPYAIVTLLFIAVVVYYIGFRLAYLLFLALVLLGVGKIQKLDLDYKKYYQIGIHTMTLPLIVDVIVNLLNTPIELPFWFFMLNFIFGIIVVSSLKKQPEVETITESPVA